MLFPLPAQRYHKTSGFRPFNRPEHVGIDLAAVEGTAVYATENGEVFVPEVEEGGAGSNLWIETAEHFFWKYFHLSEILVESGQPVWAGDLIGYVGHTGHVEPPGPAGAHLHIELHYGNPSNPIDPTDRLNQCEAAGLFPPDKEIDMTEEEWKTRVEELRKVIQNDTLGGLVAMAKVNHHYLSQAVERLGGQPLDPFSVNSVQA